MTPEGVLGNNQKLSSQKKLFIMSNEVVKLLSCRRMQNGNRLNAKTSFLGKT
jgi:hypothetical protein